MQPDLVRDAAIVVLLAGVLLAARVPLRSIVVILFLAVAVTYGVDAFFDSFNGR